MATKSRDFNQLLLQAIDDSFNSLGGTVRDAIYFHLKSQFQLSYEEIPQKIDCFQEGIEKIFGTGSRFIEILILKNLYAKINLPDVFDSANDLEFIDYINRSRQKFLA
ncbi:MAG: hypothetical protein NWF01_03580 [Candidatus Bathyarchaeota archaeon]|nr:hypothetical protein [Candidatus Bathyarchaeota archaeon]